MPAKRSGSNSKSKTPRRKQKAAGKAKAKTSKSPRRGAKGSGRKAPTAKGGGPLRFLRRAWFWKGVATLSVIVAIAIVWLDFRVTHKFEGKRWQLPAKVYARSLELYVGKPLLPEALEWELQALQYRARSALSAPGQYVELGPNHYRIHKRAFRFDDGWEDQQIIELRLRDGVVSQLRMLQNADDAALTRLDPLEVGGFYPAHKEDRLLVRLKDVPAALIEALILTEDREFHEHWGISPRGIARAAWVNVSSGALRQGGSTITQQLVKNFYLSHERTLSRKFIEMIMAVLLDWHYSKDQILETYLNEVYLGQAGAYGIHGIGLASRHYFGKPVQYLQVHEAALLVAMIRGPSYYDPWRHPDRARERRDKVLKVMHEHGALTDPQWQRARQSGLDVLAKPMKRSSQGYPAFMGLVKRQLRQEYRDEDLRSEGLRIFTNLDPYIQHQAEQALSSHLQSLDRRGLNKGHTLQGAVVVLSPHNGEVVALVGDRNPRYDGFNRALDAYRPVGSTVKPFVYLTALKQQPSALKRVIEEQPIELEMPDGSVWQPRNFDHELHGEVIAQAALVNSYNLATARLGMDIGVENVVDTLKGLNVEQDIRPLPSLLLGAVELSPMQVASLYQILAADGFATPTRAIRAVVTQDGEALSRYPVEVQQLIPPEQVFAINNALQQVVRRGTAKSLSRFINTDWTPAGKTGTTDDQRDAWFTGFTGDLLASVWVGTDDNKPTHLTGATGALPVWGKMMSQVSQQPLRLTPPENWGLPWLGIKNGYISAEYCDDAMPVALPKSALPKKRDGCAKGGRLRHWIQEWFQ